ncbi:fatty acid desaturase [Stenotrophomonas sp. TWI700]|jgi:stearoyl-CoA desaturase (delta-9 desaturase)|uniref:Stearoyl-CoA desaturase (Delta-9 desaturase) n=1 Tax=Stenotrophomonas rhizophila TaxID=216778 RepID=A0AAW5PI11_9GAMM|nr:MULTISPECIES: fatty acid desaturase [Stenotrophomonas]MBU2048579.1 fatty acid desaturase [Gammaproteobacteria bacterium]MCS4279980.1 stearoyl-CoA desaturase (delta-9 desaturase) [Stenotrophomonas rhizophila]NWF34235.1 acyl-CoA desaturase [Stenotrophomonas sp. SAM-B]NYF37113.1 stearoyl-CoA desaturase (delta-9 desaturase) [Stenotrophomonas sp. JAI102]
MFDTLLNFLTGGVVGLGWWGMGLVLLVFTQLTIFAVTLYLHRSQAHRGVDFHPVIAHFFRFWTWLTTSMITKEWVAIHRKHHAKVETDEDPHSPVTKGIGMVFWRGVELYREARAMRADIEQYGRGAPDDWIERHLYTPHANLGPVALLVINSVLFGLPGVALWAIQMAWIPFWAAGVINGLGHWWGYRNFESADTSTNLTPWAFWVGGEELHNNHHAFPSSARFSMRRWEFDIGWAVIRGLQALRLAKVLRVAPSMDVRPNIAVPDAETLKALLSHRFQAMTDYQRNVFVPALREEAAMAGAKLRKLLPRRMRRGLVNDGRWLKPDCRAQLSTWVEQRPRIRVLVEHRARLAALLEARGNDAAERLKLLQAWCHEAEASGIAALQNYAARLKGYALTAH